MGIPLSYSFARRVESWHVWHGHCTRDQVARRYEAQTIIMFHHTLRLQKLLPFAGLALLLMLLSACGASQRRTDGTNADYAAQGTPIVQARSAGDFVLMWELNGTPTPTPTPNPTDVV